MFTLCAFVHSYACVYEPEIVDLYPAPNRIYCQQPLNWNHDGWSSPKSDLASYDNTMDERKKKKKERENEKDEK